MKTNLMKSAVVTAATALALAAVPAFAETGARVNVAAGISGDHRTASTTVRADIRTHVASSTRPIEALKDRISDRRLAQPKIEIVKAANRIIAIANGLDAIASKIQARVGSSTAAVSALADLSAKTADARLQANAAISLANGVNASSTGAVATSTMKADLQIFKDARAKIKAATLDLAAARKDAGQAVGLFHSATKGREGEENDEHASSTVSASSTVHGDRGENEQDSR